MSVPDARGLPDPRALADCEALSLRFADGEAGGTALALLRRWLPEGVPTDTDGDAVLRWDDPAAFAEAREELADLGFALRVPRAHRLARIAALPTGPYAATLLRGERPLRATGYASDPGDLGSGRYLTSCAATAATYGPVSAHPVAFGRAAFATQAEAASLAGDLYRTCRGRDRIGGADTMRCDFLAAGIEALVVDGYDCRPGSVTVVDFASLPPRALRPWEEFDPPEPAPVGFRP